MGMLLASLPFAVLAQQGTILRETLPSLTPPEQSPANGLPPVYQRRVPLPPSNPIVTTPTVPDDAVSATPAPPDERDVPMPADNTESTAPAPAYDPSTPAPVDNSVTAAPLAPPSDDGTDSSQMVVPNPDNPAESAPSAQAQPRGQAERGGWLKMGSATLQALDKVNAIDKTLVVRVGDVGHFGSLDIGVRGCFVRTPDSPPDATAFLVIRDRRADAPSFTGWMDRAAPYMSMLAHPLYDVRITACTP